MNDSDRKLWRKIKRNGHFAAQKRKLVQIWAINVESAEICGNNNFGITVENETADPLIDEEVSNSSESDDDINNVTDQHELCAELRDWAITHQVKHAAINSLLIILKSFMPSNVLPKDARTLVQTPRSTIICSDVNLGGNYWHYLAICFLIPGVCRVPRLISAASSESVTASSFFNKFSAAVYVVLRPTTLHFCRVQDAISGSEFSSTDKFLKFDKGQETKLFLTHVAGTTVIAGLHSSLAVTRLHN